MHKTVQVPCRLLDCLSHLIIAVKVEDVRDEIERILVVLDFSVKACKVEPVGEVFLVDFAEVFVATGGYELQQLRLAHRSNKDTNKTSPA